MLAESGQGWTREGGVADLAWWMGLNPSKTGVKTALLSRQWASCPATKGA